MLHVMDLAVGFSKKAAMIWFGPTTVFHKGFRPQMLARMKLLDLTLVFASTVLADLDPTTLTHRASLTLPATPLVGVQAS